MEKPFTAYLGSESYVFVCYAHADSPVVYRELGLLHEHGIHIWYDEGISAGRNWRSEIGDALLGADFVLCFISQQSLQSEHCNREINLALDEGKSVIPIYLEPVELTSDLKIGLSRIQALDLRSGTAYRKQLLRVIDVKPPLAPPAQTGRGTSAGRWWKTLRIAVPAMLLCTAALWGLIGIQSTTENDKTRFNVDSIAVLPFRDRSQNAGLQWLADGIASDLTVRLQATAGLRVPSQSAVERFRIETHSPAHIAQELGVATLLSGYVVGTEDNVKIVIEVVEPIANAVLWSTESSGGSEDLMDIQRGLVARTAGFLGLRVEQPDRMDLPVGAAAYQAFLKYMHFQMTGQDHKRQEWIEKTLILEPDFAYGHLQAAWTYQQLYALTINPEMRNRTRESLLQAEALGLGDDPQWENAWGGYLSRIEGRHAEAEPVLRRAASEGVITQYAHLLLASGLVEEAAQALLVSTARYPDSLPNWGLLAAARALMGDDAGTLQAADEMLFRSPQFTHGHILKIFALMQLGRGDEAEAAIKLLRDADPSPPGLFLAQLLTGYLYAFNGRLTEVSSTAEALLEVGASMSAGMIYIAAGDPRGERLFGAGRAPFFINAPFYLAQLPPEARLNPVISHAVESHGYTPEWRLELCKRAAKLPPETGIACVPGKYAL